MAAPVSQAFLDEQSRETREPDKKVILVLDNVAAASKGSAILEGPSNDFSTDFPGKGTLDGDATHLNYGPAADADNDRGLSGWKSTDAAVAEEWDTSAEFREHVLAEDFVDAPDLKTALTDGTIRAHARHNLFLESERFDQAAWTKTSVTIVPDASVAPDGTTTADRVVEIVAGGAHWLTQAVTIAANEDVPVGFFFKPDQRTWIYLQVQSAGQIVRQWFDIANDVVGSWTTTHGGWSVVAGTARIRRVKNRPDWRRVEVIVNPAVGITSITCRAALTTGDLVVTYTGDGTSGLYIWGGLIADGGASVPPYIRTQNAETWFALDQDFDDLTAGIALAPQRGWTQSTQTGAGFINVETTARRGSSGNGVHLSAQGPIAAQSNVFHQIVPNQGLMVFEVAVNMQEGGWSTDFFEFSLEAGATRLISLYIDSDTLGAGNPHFLKVRIGVGAPVPVFDEKLLKPLTWYTLKIVMDRTVPATTLTKVFYSEDGVDDLTEAWRGEVDTTGLNRVWLAINNVNPATPPAPDWWVDDLLIHTGHPEESVHAQVLDIGGLPTGVRGRAVVDADDLAVERLVDDAYYPTINRDPTVVALRDAAAREGIGETFTPSVGVPIDSVTFELGNVGSPVGNVWVELLATSVGVPFEDVLARSLPRQPQYDFGVNVTRQRFRFPKPFVSDGTSQYGYRIMGDFPISGVNYVIATHDSTAPTYAGGQAFEWDGTTYTMKPGTDHPFVTWTAHLPLEQFDKGTEDTDLKLQDNASLWWLAEAFEVPHALRMRHLHVLVKALLPNNVNPDAVEIWFDLHADDGSGTKPSNEVLAVGARIDPTVIDWTSYEWFGLRLATFLDLVPGVRYWWVVKGTEQFNVGQPAAAMLAFASDDSSPSYANGRRAISDDSVPKVWTAVPGGAMPFRVMEEERPFWRVETAYSGDDQRYTVPEVVSHNADRSGADSQDFTGKALRYWMARAVAYVPAGPERAFGARLKSLELRAIHAEEKHITVDFGQARQIDMIRLWGHPVTGGIDAFKLRQSDDDITYTDIPASAFDPETLESYSHDEPDDRGVTLADAAAWQEDFEIGYTVDVELAGQKGWYQTAAHAAGAGNQMFPKAFGIEGATDVEIFRGTPISPLEYGWPLPIAATGFPYVFEWWEDKAAANNGEITGLRFADGADSGADAWEVRWNHTAGGATVTIVDEFGESATVFTAGLGITKQKIEIDEDLTLRYYVRNPSAPEAYVLYYTGRAQRLTADRLIVRAYTAVITFQSYDFFRFEEVLDPARLDIGGESFAGRFLATRTMRYLRVQVLDSAEGFAEVLEAQAYRTVDVSGRVVEMTEEQDAGFLQLRMKQSTLALMLQNKDRELSKRNSAGAYFGQLGGGVEIRAEVGFLGVPDRVKTGVFFVDEWNETPEPNLQITATNRVKRLDTSVRAKLRARQRYADLVEYLANKTGLPSQMVATDRAAGFVEYYIGDNVNAWSEIQKIGEAAGGSRAWVDRLGRLRMRTTGDTAADTRLSTLLIGQDYRRAFGPPAELDGKLYVSFVRAQDYGGGLQEQLQAAEYDIAAGTWRELAGGATINVVGVGQEHGYATQMIFEGELYIFLHFNPMGTTGLRIVKWDGAYTDTGSNWEIMYERADVAFGVFDDAGGGVQRAIHPSCTLRNWFNTFSADPTDAQHHRFDMHNMRHRLVAGANEVEGCVVLANGKDVFGKRMEGDSLFFLRHLGAGGGFGDRVEIVRLIFETLTDFIPPQEGKLFTISPLAAPRIFEGVDVFGMGLGDDGDAKVYTTFVAKAGTLDGMVWTQDVFDQTVTTSPAAFDRAQASIEDNARDGIAVAYVDGIVYAGSIRTLADKELALMRWDEDADEIVNAGNLSLSNSRFIHLIVAAEDGRNLLYALADEGNVVELVPGRRLPLQTTPVFEVTDDIQGAFESAAISGGDDDGESRIINVATVRSNPLVERTSETVWQGNGLPWPVALGKELSFRVSLREATLPFDAGNPNSQRINVTFDGASVATITLEPHHKSPKVKIKVSSGPPLGDLITACTIDGNTLKRNSELVAVVVGSAESIDKYGIRDREFANDYIYDQFAQAVLAASVVARHQFTRELVSGVTFRALWHLEPFDLGTLRETERLFLDSQFYITKFSRQYHGNQTMTVTVEEAVL